MLPWTVLPEIAAWISAPVAAKAGTAAEITNTNESANDVRISGLPDHRAARVLYAARRVFGSRFGERPLRRVAQGRQPFAGALRPGALLLADPELAGMLEQPFQLGACPGHLA